MVRKILWFVSNARENGIASAKRFRLCEKTDIDSIDGMVSREKFPNWNLICGPILKIKAEQFATMLGYTDFTCTTGWLDRFEAGHNICMYYEDIDTAAITSDVLTMDDIVNDIHCDKQENGDDSDADTAT
ncbi:hypothetical protein D917_06661, partial [Trichinella nativa]